MRNIDFRRTITVLAVAAAIYIGHGLHTVGEPASPLFATTAQAEGVAVIESSKSLKDIFTASPDGTTLYFWQQQQCFHPKFVATVVAKPAK